MLRPLCVLLSFSGSLALAQTVELASGEVMKGHVVGVAVNRAKVQLVEGGLRQIDLRQIACERAADGTRKWFAAECADGEMAAPVREQLQRLRSGRPLDALELQGLGDRCTKDLVRELEQLSTDKSPAVRARAVTALAMAATPESMRIALAAAKADASGALWREVVGRSVSGVCLGAIAAANGRDDVELAVATKDKSVRAAAAWIAVQLGSKTAQPALTAFVGDADHHVRESAAMCLGEAGSDAGAKVLLAIATREQSPDVEANRRAPAATRDLLVRIAHRERVRAIELLGELRHAPAATSLKALTGNADREVATAAAAAIAKLDAK